MSAGAEFPNFSFAFLLTSSRFFVYKHHVFPVQDFVLFFLGVRFEASFVLNVRVIFFTTVSRKSLSKTGVYDKHLNSTSTVGFSSAYN